MPYSTKQFLAITKIDRWRANYIICNCKHLFKLIPLGRGKVRKFSREEIECLFLMDFISKKMKLLEAEKVVVQWLKSGKQNAVEFHFPYGCITFECKKILDQIRNKLYGATK